MEIQSVVVEKAGSYQIKNVELNDPGEGELLIRMLGSGICHTDLAVLHQYVCTPLPIALGHEGAGIIEKVGAGVKNFKAGDNVVVSFSYCNDCIPCRHGHPAFCDHSQELNFGTTMAMSESKIEMNGKKVADLFGQSSLSTYCVANQKNVIKVPYNDLDVSILGPLACGIQTGAGTVLNLLRPGVGQSIAIFGCGGVGLSAVMAAALTECQNIIAVDVVPERLELAKELGATHVINGKITNTVEEIIHITRGGAEYAVESTGVPALVQTAIHCTSTLGKIAVVGGAGDTLLNVVMDLIGKGRTIIGAIEGDSISKIFIPQLLYYYREKRFPFDKLIKKYSFTELEQALTDMEKGVVVKPVIVF